MGDSLTLRPKLARVVRGEGVELTVFEVDIEDDDSVLERGIEPPSPWAGGDA